MNLKAELDHLDKAEKALIKKIDDEVALEEEIQEVSTFTAKCMLSKPIVPMSIQGRDFLVVSQQYKNESNELCINIVAREKTLIDIGNAKVIKADLVIDTNYTIEENLCVGVKALLGHITGLIKPEVME